MRINIPAALLLVLIACFSSTLSIARAQTEKPGQVPTAATPHLLNGIAAIPMRMTYDPLVTALPIVYCRINGRAPKPFLFDTGYSGTILINEEEARKLGLQINESNVVTKDINGATERLNVAQVRSCEGLTTHDTYFNTNTTQVYISKIPINNEKIYPTPAIGVIGLDLFWGATLYFDFEQQMLQIIPDEHPDVACVAGSISVPFDYNGERLTIDASDLLGIKEEMMLDTGAAKSYLSKSTVQRLKPTASYNGFAPGAFNSYAAAKTYLVPTVYGHGVILKNLLIGEASDQRALLGMDILSRFRVTMDVRRSKLVLEPTHSLQLQNEKELGRSGLALVRRNGDIYIGDAVAKYKNLVGSQLIEVGETVYKGKMIKDFPVAQVQAILDGYAGTTTTIIVRCQGAVRTIAIKRMTVPELYSPAK